MLLRSTNKIKFILIPLIYKIIGKGYRFIDRSTALAAATGKAYDLARSGPLGMPLRIYIRIGIRASYSTPLNIQTNPLRQTAFPGNHHVGSRAV